MTILDKLDMTQRLDREPYYKRLDAGQRRLVNLRFHLGGPPGSGGGRPGPLLVFRGPQAAAARTRSTDSTPTMATHPHVTTPHTRHSTERIRARESPGKVGGSRPWKRGWSYAYTGTFWEADDASVFG